MEAAELAWTIGKYVRTEDDTMFNCGATKADETREHKAWHRTTGFYEDDDCSMQDTFGGEGVVVSITENPKGLFVNLDWGYSIPVLPTTKIKEIQRGDR